MKTLLVITAFLGLLATPARARVGETVKQVEARYGKPQRILHERGSFRAVGYGYLGFMVGVSYVAGVSKSEGFTRPGTPRLSDAEVQQLLTFSLTPGTSWKPVSDKNGGRMWMRSDGKVVAFLSAQKFLQVQEKDFHQPAQ